MYFFKVQGDQRLDLRGNLVLSHNDRLIKARVSSAAPKCVKNGRYIPDLKSGGFRGFWRRWKATLAAIRFIWGSNQALTPELIQKEKS